MSNARRRYRQKKKDERQLELNHDPRRMLGGTKDLTPHNAEALMRARDADGKVSRVYVIEFK